MTQDRLKADGSIRSTARLAVDDVRVIIYDAAHPEPDKLRNFALTATFHRRENDSYPGVRTAVPESYRGWLQSMLAVNGGIQPVEILDATFAIACDHPGVLAPIQRIPHFDTVDPDVLALVHYLADRDHGGTSFYRQRSTGFSFVDASRLQRWRDSLILDGRVHGLPSGAYIGQSTSMYERLEMVDFAYNRLIAYPANCLHSADLGNESLSADPAAGRLTITSLVRTASRSKQPTI